MVLAKTVREDSMNQRITTSEELEATGAYAWPGGHPILYIGSESAVICFDCAKLSLGGNDPTLFAVVNDAYDTEYCDDCGKEIS
jgi:hypothetical protein